MMSGTQTVAVAPLQPQSTIREANVVVEPESDDEMPVIRKARRERVEEAEDNSLIRNEEVGISTEDALVNYSGEPTFTVNVC